MRRELWALATAFISGVKIINSAFRMKDEEHELPDNEIWLMAERINSECSTLMLEDAQTILSMVASLPESKRFCVKTDCLYHHAKNIQFSDRLPTEKCDDCTRNEKCKNEDKIDYYECNS